LLSGECREDVLEIEPAAESSLSTKAAERITTTAEGVACAAEGIASRSAAGIEACSAKLVILLSLLRVGEDLIGRLNIRKPVFRVGILVRVWMVFLCEAVVCLLDLGRRRTFAYAQSLIRVFLREAVRSMKGLEIVSSKTFKEWSVISDTYSSC
jgi:hypothetical protein